MAETILLTSAKDYFEEGGVKRMRVDEPFIANWTIQVKGRTQADGEVFVVTAQVIRDQLMGILDQMVLDKKIEEYSIVVKNKEE